MVLVIFLAFVIFVIALSFYLGHRTKTSAGYYAAGGQIHWSVNGIAFAGDYLSAASFLGICGMIATVGYDGFLYSIGYLAGWIVALFVVAEAMKRLGKYTFTDALDSKFNSRGIKLAAAISTLVVSICYLIPQMVGAGVLVEPLLGIAQHWGVIIVGAVVITIVATAGMASTTYVQFLKGGLLIIFSLALVIAVCWKGFTTQPVPVGYSHYEYRSLPAAEVDGRIVIADSTLQIVQEYTDASSHARLVRLTQDGQQSWWRVEAGQNGPILNETQSVVVAADGSKFINSLPASETNTLRPVGNVELLRGKKVTSSGSVSPVEMLAALSDKNTVVRRWKDIKFTDADGSKVTV
ncbi:MAG: sodium:solute symporter family transporter, partial [Calditrichota bacterium]